MAKSNDKVILCKILSKKGGAYELQPLDNELSEHTLLSINAPMRLVVGDTVEAQVLDYFTKNNQPRARIIRRVQNPNDPASFRPRRKRK